MEVPFQAHRSVNRRSASWISSTIGVSIYSFQERRPTSIKIVVFGPVYIIRIIWIVAWKLIVYSFWIAGDLINVVYIVYGTARLWYTLTKIPVAAMHRDRLMRDRMGWIIDIITVDA
jgi:hypothetical protein